MAHEGSGEGEKPFLVVSDVHLGAVPATTERAFLDFLSFAASHARGLLIAGDLFDVWFASRHFVPRRYVRPLACLADAVETGLRVVFIGGNRDVAEWGEDVLREDVGAEVLPDPARVRLAGRTALVAHGDGIRAGRERYHKPYSLLRHPATIWAAHRLLPENLLFGMLTKHSGTLEWVARHARGESTGAKARAPHVESWARAQLAADPELSLVICGHSHLPALVNVGPGRYYVNAGDWISHFTYAVIPSGNDGPRVLRWPSQEPVDWTRLDDGTSRTTLP